MVFQEDTLLPWLTVADNVGLFYRFRGRVRKEDRDHIADLLKMVNLEKFAGYFPYQLSGGMRRRAAMLTAIAPQPELLLLDEPFSALDEPTRISVHRDLYMLLRRLKISAVLVTHDLAEAISLSDRILVLSRPPAHVVEEIPVRFGIERNMLDLRDSPEFLRLYGHLWQALKEQLI
jgi:ABC-type nitrate/sulfonate/bicarbonate transport system ATPase subunit